MCKFCPILLLMLLGTELGRFFAASDEITDKTAMRTLTTETRAKGTSATRYISN
jgi:hypothetical protein